MKLNDICEKIRINIAFKALSELSENEIDEILNEIIEDFRDSQSSFVYTS